MTSLRNKHVPWMLIFGERMSSQTVILLVLINFTPIYIASTIVQDVEEFYGSCFYCNGSLPSDCYQTEYCGEEDGNRCHTYREGDLLWKGCGCPGQGNTDTCCTGDNCNENMPEIAKRSVFNTDDSDEEFGNHCMFCNKKSESQCKLKLRCYKSFGEKCYAYKKQNYVWKGCGCDKGNKKDMKCCDGEYCNEKILQADKKDKDEDGSDSDSSDSDSSDSDSSDSDSSDSDSSDSDSDDKDSGDKDSNDVDKLELHKDDKDKDDKDKDDKDKDDKDKDDKDKNDKDKNDKDKESGSHKEGRDSSRACYVCGKTTKSHCKTTMTCKKKYGHSCYTYVKDGYYWYGCGCPTIKRSKEGLKCCSGEECNGPRPPKESHLKKSLTDEEGQSISDDKEEDNKEEEDKEEEDKEEEDKEENDKEEEDKEENDKEEEDKEENDKEENDKEEDDKEEDDVPGVEKRDNFKLKIQMSNGDGDGEKQAEKEKPKKHRWRFWKKWRLSKRDRWALGGFVLFIIVLGAIGIVLIYKKNKDSKRSQDSGF